MKKLISSLLALAMLLSLMPLSVLATEEETQARNPIVELYVGTVNALETPQGDGWSFDAESGVLTLNNCTLTESMLHVETDEWGSDRYDAMIYVKGDLTIELIGTNSVERVIEEAPTDYTNYYAICNSIYCPSDWEMPGSLTFVGDGNLTVGVAVSRDYLSEDGYSTNEAWEYLEFSSGIASWNYTDLSGLYGGGWMDIYGGVYGIEAPYIARAFANYPTFGDNCIVTAYQDVDGTIENENGYNWNNNDAWRMKVVTGNAILKDNGQLILMDTDSASGVGWTWENQVLTLSEGTEVKAVDLRSRVGSAKLVLTGDVTLDGTDLGTDADWNYISAIETRCDLEIDAGEHTLTFTGETGGITSYLSDVLISGGTVADTGTGYIGVLGGDLTVQDTTLRLGCGIALSEGYDADNNTVPAGAMLVKDSVLVLDDELCSYGSLTVTGSDVTVTGGYYAMRGSEFLTVQDSILDLNGYNYALFSYGNVTVDNCDLNLIGEVCVIGRYNHYYEGDDESIIPDASCFQLLNMDITQPEGCTVRVVENVYEYYTMYEVQVVDSAGNPATTLKATAAGTDAHEHTYTNGVCSCGKKQTFTITWKNDDGTILEVDTVEYGDHPEYNGPTPTKTGEGYEYTFYAWSNGTQYTNVEQVTVTRDWTYTAGYNKIAHKHDLIFMDGDVELARQEVNYNSSLSSYTLNSYAGNPAKDCYTLSGWAYADGTQLASNVYLNMPDEDVVLYAVWDGPNHTWVDATCEAPKTCSVCGETEGEALGHSYTEGVCACGKKLTFTITWKNWDGTVLETDTVEYGVKPEYNGSTPTKEVTGQTCTFAGWGTVNKATADMTYTATFYQTANKYNVILMDGDTELGRHELAYDAIVSESSLPEYAGNPTKPCCTIAGWQYADGTAFSSTRMTAEDMVLYIVWDGPNHTWAEATCEAPKTCTSCGLTEGEALSDHNYVDGVCACGKIQTFTITWVNWDGTVLEVDTVEYGTVPTYDGAAPTRPNVGYDYTFSGWAIGNTYQQTIAAAVCDRTYTAFYVGAAHNHDIVFMDGETELARKELYYDKYVSVSAATLNGYAGNPTKACYTLSGWAYADGTLVTSAFYMPDEDVVLYAVWDGPDHTWVDATCEAPKTCSVCGETEGEALEHTYTEGVCSCGAKQTFTITWVNWDGTVLEVDTVEYGTVPTYDGATPIRPNVGYDFTFYGWALSASGAETTPGAATQDRTYYAKYTSTVHYHDIIFMDEDMVTELGRYETYYDKLIATSWLTTASGITVPPCYTAWWCYEDGSMPEESFRMPDHDVVLYIMWEGPGHVYDGVITTEPTCTQEGVMTYTCIGCGDSYTDSLWPKGHSYAGVVTEPTCTEGGYTTYTCSDCGDSYVGDQVAAHGHDYCNYVTTEPTCTTDGYTTYSCMFCGDSYVTDIVEGGHKFGVIYITNATCTEYGSSSGTCIVCGELVTDDAYEAPLGHDYIAEITQAPSCSAAGVMTYTCTRCADSYTEEIAAFAHDFSTGAQCTTCGTDAEASVTIGGIVTYYATAYEASTAVQYCTEEDNALIVLLKDIVLEKSFDRYISLKNCVCTLDLNGKTVYGNSQNYEPIRVRFDSDVTIVDSVGTGKVTGGANTFGVVYSTLTVNGGTFIGTQYGASSSGDSTVIINGGTFEGKYGGCFYDCDVIINGGTFTGTEYGLYVRKTGGDTSTTTINGGTISGTVCDIYVYSAESTVTLSVGEDGIGATFPGGISVDGTDLAKRPLNALLGEGMTYWCNGSAISFIDDVYDFSGGDVTVRKICQHSYENGYCTECGAKDPNYVEIVKPTVTLKYPTLAFEDEILYNVYFNVDNMTSVKEMGLVIFADRNENGTVADAIETIPGFVINADGSYTVHSNGIPAKMLGDAVYFKVYAKLSDGSYVYSGIAGYHAVLYANTVLNSDAASAKAKALVVAMLNYGAAAQVSFEYKTDSLMNAGLTEAHQALIEEYNESMVATVPSATSKAGSFVNNGGYSDLHPTVSFEGAFSINYYFTTKYTPDDGVVNFYYWNFDAFNAAETLTPENATGTVQMTSDGNVYTNPVEGIAAKQIDEPVYVAGLYTNGGTTYTTPVIGYSLGAYCKNIAANGNAFGAATAVYGFYAKAYFA